VRPILFRTLCRLFRSLFSEYHLFRVAIVLGLKIILNSLTNVVLLPTAVQFIGIGLLCGTVFTENMWRNLWCRPDKCECVLSGHGLNRIWGCAFQSIAYALRLFMQWKSAESCGKRNTVIFFHICVVIDMPWDRGDCGNGFQKEDEQR
jgi:hypothetical protein